MKSLKTLVLMLSLTVVPWAQTAAPDNNNPPAQITTKATCPCCQKMADAKDAKSCCAHHDMAAKDGKAMSCCSGKDAKSCVKDDKKQTAACAKEGCCSMEGKDCCKKDGDKSTMACCSGGQCGMHHDTEPDAMK